MQRDEDRRDQAPLISAMLTALDVTYLALARDIPDPPPPPVQPQEDTHGAS